MALHFTFTIVSIALFYLIICRSLGIVCSTVGGALGLGCSLPTTLQQGAYDNNAFEYLNQEQVYLSLG